MTIEQRQAFEVASDVLSQEVGEETVLLDLNNDVYFALDEVGSRLWQLIKARANFQEIVSTLLQEYDVEESQLTTDVEALLEQLLEARLVKPARIKNEAD